GRKLSAICPCDLSPRFALSILNYALCSANEKARLARRIVPSTRLLTLAMLGLLCCGAPVRAHALGASLQIDPDRLALAAPASVGTLAACPTTSILPASLAASEIASSDMVSHIASLRRVH